MSEAHWLEHEDRPKRHMSDRRPTVRLLHSPGRHKNGWARKDGSDVEIRNSREVRREGLHDVWILEVRERG